MTRFREIFILVPAFVLIGLLSGCGGEGGIAETGQAITAKAKATGAVLNDLSNRTGEMIGPKAEQAIGVGTTTVGCGIIAVNPPVGIAVATAGVAIAAHGASREETREAK